MQEKKQVLVQTRHQEMAAEREVATLVKRGMTCKEIAESRGIGLKSVENARVALRRKLGLDRRANLRAALQEYGDL